MHLFYNLIVLVLICSCNNENKKQYIINDNNSIPIINLTTIDKATTELKATSFFSKISYIPLETTNDCLLGQSQICYADSTQFVIQSESELFRFSSKGLFLNKIGNKGRGLGEYLHPSNVFFDREKSMFRVSDLQSKQTLFFSSNGEFIKDENFKSIGKNRFEYCFIDDKNILASFRSTNRKNNKVVRDEMHIFNEKNDTLFSLYDIFMPGAQKLSFFYYPSIQHSFLKSFVKLPFNDTIYSVDSKSGFSPIAVLYCGKEKMPRHIAEDFSLNKKNRTKYITGITSLISSRYIFLSFYRKNVKYLVVFDIEKNIVIGAEKLLFENFAPGFRQIGISDDIRKKDIKFFPTYINENKAYNISYYTCEGKTENDNPTVIIGYFK